MAYHYDLSPRDMALSKYSNKPEDKLYALQHERWIKHVTVTNKWLRVDQNACSWSVIPGHIKYRMWTSQRRMGVNWNIVEFITKAK